MGQKVHPLGLRIGITQKHRSNWFAKTSHYPRFVMEDHLLRSYILKKYPKAYISQIYINRSKTTQNQETQKTADLVEMSIYAATPRTLFASKNKDKAKGKMKGNAIDVQKKLTELKTELEQLCQRNRSKYDLPAIRIILTIFKVKNIYSDASVLADFLIEQLEQRVPFRSALKKTLKQTNLKMVQGIKIQISGRLNGAEMARTEWVRKGRVPLQTLRADIDYSYKMAKTIYGILGIKIWVLKNDN